jgi:hypothetical protein
MDEATLRARVVAVRRILQRFSDPAGDLFHRVKAAELLHALDPKLESLDFGPFGALGELPRRASEAAPPSSPRPRTLNRDPAASTSASTRATFEPSAAPDQKRASELLGEEDGADPRTKGRGGIPILPISVAGPAPAHSGETAEARRARALYIDQKASTSRARANPLPPVSAADAPESRGAQTSEPRNATIASENLALGARPNSPALAEPERQGSDEGARHAAAGPLFRALALLGQISDGALEASSRPALAKPRSRDSETERLGASAGAGPEAPKVAPLALLGGAAELRSQTTAAESVPIVEGAPAVPRSLAAQRTLYALPGGGAAADSPKTARPGAFERAFEMEPEAVTSLVNEVLIEQARRQGVDLS